MAHEVGGEHIEYGRAAVVYGFQPSVLVPHLTVLEFLRLRLRQLSALIVPQFVPNIRVVPVECAYVVSRGLDLRGVEYNESVGRGNILVINADILYAFEYDPVIARFFCKPSYFRSTVSLGCNLHFHSRNNSAQFCGEFYAPAEPCRHLEYVVSRNIDCIVSP